MGIVGACLNFSFGFSSFFPQVSDRAEYVGSALLHRGFKPSHSQYIGVFAQNRPEVIDRVSISDLAVI